MSCYIDLSLEVLLIEFNRIIEFVEYLFGNFENEND